MSENVGLGRLEAFSDGVFAIAVTLLILDVHEATGGGSLAHRLGAAWPTYLAYVVSFVMIGIMWLNHHQLIRYADSGPHSLQVANLFLLLLVTFVPFPTRVVGDAFTNGGHDSQQTAALFYGLTFTAIGIGFGVLWLTISFRRRLLRPEISDFEVKMQTRRILIGAPAFAIAALVALINPTVSVGLDGLLALTYLLPTPKIKAAPLASDFANPNP